MAKIKKIMPVIGLPIFGLAILQTINEFYSHTIEACFNYNAHV